MAIGEIPGIEPGARFERRRQLYDAGVHRALMAGIVGRAKSGAESIVLSGKYVDDGIESGRIVYTGHGGRNATNSRQFEDQKLSPQNASLIYSCENSLPVRVVRKLDDGSYEYGGLYRVVEHRYERGVDGFKVYRFVLEAMR